MNHADPPLVHDTTPETARPHHAPSGTIQRIDLPCAAIGLTPAPHTVHMVPIRRGQSWTLLAMTDPGKPAEVARWLDRHDPIDLEIGPGLAPRTLRADFGPLPERWQQVFDALTIQAIVVTPEGVVSLFADEGETEVESFVQDLKEQAPDPARIRTRRALGSWSEVALTRRQRDVLSAAVALGYYEVPHQVSLRQLAAEMGVSLGAVSELLRRAESQIVRRHIDGLTEDRVTALLERGLH